MTKKKNEKIIGNIIYARFTTFAPVTVVLVYRQFIYRDDKTNGDWSIEHRHFSTRQIALKTSQVWTFVASFVIAGSGVDPTYGLQLSRSCDYYILRASDPMVFRKTFLVIIHICTMRVVCCKCLNYKYIHKCTRSIRGVLGQSSPHCCDNRDVRYLRPLQSVRENITKTFTVYHIYLYHRVAPHNNNIIVFLKWLSYLLESAKRTN